MSLLTTYYKLKKLLLTDSPPDITQINDNWDTIDTQLKNGSDHQNNTDFHVTPAQKGTWNGKAEASHNHTVSNISNFPTSLLANGGNADTVDNKHASDFAPITHSNNADIHVTTVDKNYWGGKAAGNHSHTPASIGALPSSGTAQNADKLGNKPLSSVGNRRNVIPFVESDGVMEVGHVIDFHNSGGDNSDFSVRLTGTSDGISMGQGNVGIVGKVTRATGQFAHNTARANIIGQCFTTNLGNGHFRFDISGKWYVHAGYTDHYYGIGKNALSKCAYHNINFSGQTYLSDLTGSVSLTYPISVADCQIWNATDGNYGMNNVDYGWALQGQDTFFCLARMYTYNGDVGGWQSSVIQPSYPSGFWFKATIFAKLS